MSQLQAYSKAEAVAQWLELTPVILASRMGSQLETLPHFQPSSLPISPGQQHGPLACATNVED